jgi:hypothetical protein
MMRIELLQTFGPPLTFPFGRLATALVVNKDKKVKTLPDV